MLSQEKLYTSDIAVCYSSFSTPRTALSTLIFCANTRNVELITTKMRFRFDLSDVDSNADKLKSGDYHFALLEQHNVTREMDSKILRAERYRLFGPASWKRRLLSDILETESIIDFDQKDQMTFYLLDKYKLKYKANTG